MITLIENDYDLYEFLSPQTESSSILNQENENELLEMMIEEQKNNDDGLFLSLPDTTGPINFYENEEEEFEQQLPICMEEFEQQLPIYAEESKTMNDDQSFEKDYHKDIIKEARDYMNLIVQRSKSPKTKKEVCKKNDVIGAIYNTINKPKEYISTSSMSKKNFAIKQINTILKNTKKIKTNEEKNCLKYINIVNRTYLNNLNIYLNLKNHQNNWIMKKVFENDDYYNNYSKMSIVMNIENYPLIFDVTSVPFKKRESEMKYISDDVQIKKLPPRLFICGKKNASFSSSSRSQLEFDAVHNYLKKGRMLIMRGLVTNDENYRQSVCNIKINIDKEKQCNILTKLYSSIENIGVTPLVREKIDEYVNHCLVSAIIDETTKFIASEIYKIFDVFWECYNHYHYEREREEEDLYEYEIDDDTERENEREEIMKLKNETIKQCHEYCKSFIKYVVSEIYMYHKNETIDSVLKNYHKDGINTVLKNSIQESIKLLNDYLLLFNKCGRFFAKQYVLDCCEFYKIFILPEGDEDYDGCIYNSINPPPLSTDSNSSTTTGTRTACGIDWISKNCIQILYEVLYLSGFYSIFYGGNKPVSLPCLRRFVKKIRIPNYDSQTYVYDPLKKLNCCRKYRQEVVDKSKIFCGVKQILYVQLDTCEITLECLINLWFPMINKFINCLSGLYIYNCEWIKYMESFMSNIPREFVFSEPYTTFCGKSSVIEFVESFTTWADQTLPSNIEIDPSSLFGCYHIQKNIQETYTGQKYWEHQIMYAIQYYESNSEPVLTDAEKERGKKFSLKFLRETTAETKNLYYICIVQSVEYFCKLVELIPYAICHASFLKVWYTCYRLAIKYWMDDHVVNSHYTSFVQGDLPSRYGPCEYYILSLLNYNLTPKFILYKEE